MTFSKSSTPRVLPRGAKATGSRFKIVFVTHGEGRGRTVATDNAFLQRLQQNDPALVNDIRIHRTGSGPFDFRDVGLIVFWLGDPLRQKYPLCYAEAVGIETTASLYGIRVLNSPFGLSNTSKADQARIQKQAGVAKAAWRATGDETSLFSRFDHTARAIVFGGDVKASHLFFSTARRFGLGARTQDAMIAADLDHFETPVAHAAQLVKAVAALGLDFAAVDYSIMPDGQLVILEANPFFELAAGGQGAFAAGRQATRRVEETFDWMAGHLKAAYEGALIAADQIGHAANIEPVYTRA